MKTYRANATDINKTPLVIRYVFVVQLNPPPKGRGELIGATTTHRTLTENLNLDVVSIRVVDLRNNLVSFLRLDQMPSFLDEWRENYFDPDWDIPFQFFQ